MASVVPGRFTAEMDQPFVVFLIGMRINRLRSVRKWLPTLMAMGPMLRTLFEHPEKGFLGGQTYLSWRGVTMVQYWRSFEDLERFARDRDDPHVEAWRRFNRTIGADSTVGIWHETYVVEAGGYEAIYGNMPVYGLASATQHVPVARRGDSARQRREAVAATRSLETTAVNYQQP